MRHHAKKNTNKMNKKVSTQMLLSHLVRIEVRAYNRIDMLLEVCVTMKISFAPSF